MRYVRRGMAALLTVVLAFAMCSGASAWENTTRSDAVVSAALAEVGYTEGENEYSKYGKWYGLSHSYWCAMFVSWAANEADVPARIIPKAAYCPYQVSGFRSAGRFYDSPSLGGDYVPRQGDIIFFYDPDANTPVASHVGIVLYVENGEVFSIEGNALTGRMDITGVSGEYDESMDPPDYVTVNRYPLDARRILGYGVPDYGDRTALELTGFVDLGNYAEQAETFERLTEADILPGTSSHTYSPRQGLSRGEFIASLMRLYGLSGWAEETAEFADVPANSAYYDALMTARSLGILAGNSDGNAEADRYITGEEAQAFISRTLACLGLEDRQFELTSGDYIIFGDYTIRADLSAALDTLLEDLRIPADYPGSITRKGKELDWTLLTMDGVTYAPADALKERYPRLKICLPETNRPISGEVRVLPDTLELEVKKEKLTVPAFWKEGKWYVALRPTAELLGVTLTWAQDSGTIDLDR